MALTALTDFLTLFIHIINQNKLMKCYVNFVGAKVKVRAYEYVNMGARWE